MQPTVVIRTSAYDILSARGGKGPFAVLDRLVREGLSDEEARLVGRAVASEFGRRIRRGETVDGTPIDPNSPGWQARKRMSGDRMQGPLTDTGAMTEPEDPPWDVQIERTERGLKIRFTLAPEHREKWRRIHEIAQKSGKNWDQAWGFGASEREMAMNYLAAAVARRLRT